MPAKTICNLTHRAALVAIVLCAVLPDVRAQPPPAQILTLPNGLKYQFAGVTLDTKNVPPSLEADLVNALPKPLEKMARQYAGTKITQFNADEKFATPNLFVWFHRLGTNVPASRTSPPLTARLTDQNGVAGGVAATAAFDTSVAWSYAEFPIFPRRSRVIQCDLYPFGGGNPALPVGQISFPNPYFDQFPEWKLEPVPAVKKAGDLEVRLVNLMTGVPGSGRPPVLANGKQGLDYRPAQKGMGVTTYFDVSLQSERGTNEEWVVQNAALSDATGNVLASSSNTSSSGNNVSPMTFSGEYRLSIAGTLWPDEAAWRLSLDLKRKSGFAPDEYVTFKNVPVPKIGATNFLPITATVGGVQLVLKEFVENGDRTNIRYPRGTNASYVVNDHTPETMVAVELPEHPEGIAVDFVKMTADTGEVFEKHGNSWRPFYRGASMKFIPTNAQTVDITWVVQKMRSVEFLVKPPPPN